MGHLSAGRTSAAVGSARSSGSERGGERVELAAVRPADGRPDHRAEQPHGTGHLAVGQKAHPRPVAVRTQV